VPYTGAPLSRAGATGEPVGCGDDNGQGNIDPSPFVDSDGRAYLYVSTDFTGGRLAPTISVIPLASDLVHASGGRTPLFAGDDGGWEAAGAPAPTVEGPSMVKHGSDYYLLYSGGSWITTYAMGYARSSSATGGFVKAASGPILGAHGSVYSPGGADRPVVGPHGDTWLVYHARDGGYDAYRSLHLDRFAWRPGADGRDVPVIEGPTETPQPRGP
jgi:beta-xylosidase